MKGLSLFVTTTALFLTACGQQEPAEPQAATDDQAAPPAEETTAVEPQFDQAFVDHMHAHAEQLDELMFALADDDLEAAMTSAYWLSRHETVDGVPDEWMHYITGMRKAALDVEAATDIEAARASAEEISAQCQACHTAAGVNTNDHPE